MTLRRLTAAGAIALSLLIALLWLVNPAAADVQVVHLCATNYPSIQAAIDDAGPGQDVRVPVGVYTETLVITKTLTLQGGWAAGCANRATSDPAQTVIDANQAGSVISITEESPTIESLTVTGGWAAKGGGIYIYGASPTLRRLIITGNAVSTTVDQRTEGGGVYISSVSTTLDHCDVVSNVAYVYPGQPATGAGVYVRSSSLDVYFIGTRIMHNTGDPDANTIGGGLMVGGVPRLHFLGGSNLIYDNVAREGGGIWTQTGITGVAVISNTAGWHGGGIAVDGRFHGAVANCLVADNWAGNFGSGVLAAHGIQMINNTIVGNRGAYAVHLTSDSLGMTLTNNIVVSNEGGIQNYTAAVSPTLQTNDVWNNGSNYSGVSAGTTDLHVDPQFVDAPGGDYHLADDSPLIDAGTIVPDVVADFDGDPRPIGVSHDIGFDEWGRFLFMPLVLRAFP